ncbi:BamA/TamA family outer membrane protein [Nodosilinea sp. LEGE 07088]|uniref:BamA/TamA family outer membrane protein n=1 Tax=Nodosilinea sp. LEGE 07088 TaxID=2777968 RepID=UPI00187E2336|nr:BamA/TamA family outer membrane protein [Nodosilinea sp. LEGE 07088]MBE9137714.1 BamA/TamA family outer membrane protein [Nodosilinea sp. LEGE 07088]
MRVSPKLLALLAASGLLGLVAAPALANPTTALESSPEPSPSAADADYELNASSLAAPLPTQALGDSEPTDTLDFGRLQPDSSPSQVAETLQGAIDGYRGSGGDRLSQAADSAAPTQLDALDNLELSQITEAPSDLGDGSEFSQAIETQGDLPDSLDLSQTPSTQREITPEEAQRILDGAVQRRNQPQATPDESGQVDADEDVDEAIDEATDESAEEAPEEPVEEAEEEPRVLVAEVEVQASQGELDPELENLIYSVVETQAGRTTTRTQLQQDINSIFATGFFADVDASPEDTDLGVRVTFIVAPNPVLTDVQVEGNEVLPQTVVDDIFAEQKGEIINLIDFQEGILELNQWYQDQGYVLAQVVAAPQVSPEGVVTLEVAEGVIENIEVRYINELGESVDEEGNPIQGRTRPFIVTREFETQPGDVFNQADIEEDFQRVFGLGIFEDVVPGLEPAPEDPRQVTVIVNIRERNTGSVAAGLGFNFTGDLFGTVSFRQDNFGGNNQKFSAEAQISTRDLLFDISFTDPWIAGDPFRTSYTATAFARLANNLNFDGGPTPINLSNGDQVRIRRLGTGITFSRPLDNGWTVAVGTLIQNVSSRDQGGRVNAVDAAGNPLTASGTGVDDLWTFPLSATLDSRNDAFNPTSGSVLRLNTEQSVPLGRGSIFMNRLRGSYSYYIPLRLLNFTEGPQALALNVQAGTIIGDVPPYEAFALGGTNSIRGYDEGEVGSGRSYAQLTAEYRFPLFSFLGGALFVDVGTDLGSGNAVPGAPGPSRGKPGSGIGYGAGVRVSTPLGPLRIDYGFNNQGQGRIHFGFGERF